MILHQIGNLLRMQASNNKYIKFWVLLWKQMLRKGHIHKPRSYLTIEMGDTLPNTHIPNHNEKTV